MSHHADSARRPRRSRLSDWLPGGLLVAGVCAIGFYLAQDPQTREQVRNALGFGSQAPRSVPTDEKQVDADVEEVDPIEAMELPRSNRRLPSGDMEYLAESDIEESARPNFLPASRVHRRTTGEQEVSAYETDADLQLDQRFESDQLSDATDVVRTADLVGTAEDRGDRLESTTRDSSAPRATTSQTLIEKGRRRLESDENPSDVQLTAGDDRKPATGTARPGRPTVKTSPAAATAGAKSLDLKEVQGLIEQGQDGEAYQKLSEAYFQVPSQRPLFQPQLDDVAQRIYFSPQPQIQPPYEIQPGDQLRKIANKYQLSWQYLSRLNQVDAKKIRPGKLLKVFQGPFEAKVDLSDFELTVMLSGQYVKRYAVGIGKTNSTPIGEFTVREKLENPTYYGPNGMVVEGDDPQNPLGERWIDIGNSFGIHGTIEPDSIGKSESAGCVRMRNEDVAEVYDLLTVGSQVRIQR